MTLVDALPKSLAGLLLFLAAGPLLGNEAISLGQEDFLRLGIRFEPAAAPDGEAGMRFPATVIDSPETISAVTARHQGVLERWHAQPGQRVASGALLAELRSPELLALQQQWIEAEAALEEARFQLDKDESLFGQGIIAEQRLMGTRRDWRQTAFARDAAAEALARAGFSAAQMAALRDGEGELGVYFLRAPLDGTLSHRAAQAGAFVNAGETVATVSGGARWLRAELPARLAPSLEEGQPLRAPEAGAPLVLRQKDFEVQSDSQTVEILAEFTAEVDLLPGRVLSVVIPPPHGGIWLPADAVVHSGGETTVYVRSEGGVEARVLELLPAGEGYLARQGIEEGELVAVEGAAILKGIQLGLGGE